MSLRRSGRMIQQKATTSKYFLKTEASIKSEPLDQIDSNIPVIVKNEFDIIPKEEEVEQQISKRRKISNPVEIKIEVENKGVGDDLLLKLEPDEMNELNDILPLIPPKTLNPAPKNWFEIYQHVKQMRSKIISPVDTMGCAEIPNTLNQEMPELPREIYRFQLLVSLMLSSQTKDEVNYKAMLKMKQHFQSVGYKMGITVEAINEVDEKKLDQLIFSVGFHTRKAAFLKKAAAILIQQHNGDIPDTLDGLVALPGVGPKMAYLTLQKAWNMNVGIGVDTHVDRLAKMWRWVDPKKCKTPEHTRIELQKWLPQEYWNPINPVLVGFGQVICLPRGRRCDLCTLSQTNLCNNVDRALLKKVKSLTPEEMKIKNKSIRGDITLLKDIEDLA